MEGNMRTREEARKQYTVFKNIKAAWKDMGILGVRYYFLYVIDILIQVAVPLLLILAPAEIVRLLGDGAELSELIQYILTWLGLILIANLIRTYADKQVIDMSQALREFRFWGNINKRVLASDLRQLEDKDVQKRMHEARWSLSEGDGTGHFAGPKGFYFYGRMFLVSVLGLILYSFLAVNVNVVLLLVLFVTSVLTCYVNSKSTKYEFDHIGGFWDNNRRFWYLKKESINHEKSKDVRVYRMHGWFKRELKSNTEEATNIYGDIKQKRMYTNYIAKGLAFIRDIFCYIYLIVQMRNGQLTIAEFVLYIGVIIGFGTWVLQIVESYTFFKKISNQLAVYYDYISDLDEDEKHSFTKEAYDEIPEECHEIVFKNVTFSYEDKKIFENFNLTIKEGEKIALVGINGAGKTTLMKLLCGLYPLDEGRILVDGKDIDKIDKESYYQYISILFQDVRVLPFSIAKNVACGWTKEEQEELEELYNHNIVGKGFKKLDARRASNNSFDLERVENALKRANLWDKVASLSRGIDTPLTKVLDAEGILLSGGETQRLMLARALYKDAPILILDEPTAALDPIAESELYEEYAELCTKKISVFISHRLSSTRFCDRILFLENGKIEEEGTHDALMSLEGKYASMYNVQSHYYQREVEKVNAGI